MSEEIKCKDCGIIISEGQVASGVNFGSTEVWYRCESCFNTCNKTQTGINGFKRNEDGTFAEGTAPGPGRPELTPEQALVKRAIKDLVNEYKEDLAQYLPQIKAKLGEKAVAGDIQFIKELHDRVMGKPEQHTDITTQGRPIIELAKEIVEKNEINTSTSDNSEGQTPV
jgi:hypothetical protein